MGSQDKILEDHEPKMNEGSYANKTRGQERKKATRKTSPER